LIKKNEKNPQPERLTHEDLTAVKKEGLVATGAGVPTEAVEEVDLGEEDLGQLPPALAEILQDEAIRSLLKLTPEEIKVLKSFRFVPSFKPSKEFYFRALFDYRKSIEEGHKEL